MKNYPVVCFVALLVLTGCFAPTETSQLTPTSRLDGADVPAKAQSCYGCHGLRGGRTAHHMVPNLAGQRVDYLLLQMRRFQRGDSRGPIRESVMATRDNRSMRWHAEKLTDEDMNELAGFFASQACPHGKTAQRPLPDNRCASCHGNNGISGQENVPNLAGQSAPYMLGQLQKFMESGKGSRPVVGRPKRLHPVMSEVAAGLDAAQVVSVYIYAGMRCR